MILTTVSLSLSPSIFFGSLYPNAEQYEMHSVCDLDVDVHVVDADGRLTGPDAVKFFSLSQLPRADLKQVCLWEGFLFLAMSNYFGILLLYTAMHALCYSPQFINYILDLASLYYGNNGLKQFG
jgi:hypothetical protein